MDTFSNAHKPGHSNGDELVAKSLDQLDILSRYAVIHEISRIDKILSQAFVSDFSRRLVQKPAS